MFQRFMKMGQKKPSKPETVETPVPSSAPPDVMVNHASRQSATTPPPAPVLTVPQNLGVVEVLPNLKEVPVQEKHNVFIRKVQVCCFQFDFIDKMKSVREKEIKRQTLAELVDLVQSGSFKMNEIMQEEMVKMIALNIFRCLPVSCHENADLEGIDPDEEEPFMDPWWPHLQLVYELLLKYVVSSCTDAMIAKRYLDHSFVTKLLNLLDSEDPREREYLKIIIHRMYSRFMIHRPFTRNAINNVLYRFLFEMERYNGINELLEILAGIITGLVLPMREEHKLFLVRTLIPLHKCKCVASYHLQLSYCITQFVEKDYRLAEIVIRGILKYWPLINCGKEVLFLGELEEVLECTQPAEFQHCMVPLFKQIGRSLNSPHFQVAERALFWWNNDHIVGLITENRRVILPIIFDAIENNVNCHWNPAINGLSSNVRKMFLEMDSELFEECQRRHEEKESKAGEVEEQRLSNWKRLEEAAAQTS